MARRDSTDPLDIVGVPHIPAAHERLNESFHRRLTGGLVEARSRRDKVRKIDERLSWGIIAAEAARACWPCLSSWGTRRAAVRRAASRACWRWGMRFGHGNHVAHRPRAGADGSMYEAGHASATIPPGGTRRAGCQPGGMTDPGEPRKP